MKNYSIKLLSQSVSVLMMSGGIATITWANDQNQLPTITTQAEAINAYADGKLSNVSKLGALGEKKLIDTPFTVTQYEEQLIRERQASTVGDVLKNDASIRLTTNQGHLNENFKIRGFDLNHEDMNYNGFYGVAPYGKVPTEFLESVTVLKGPNAIVAGMAPNGGVGGVVIANSKRADKDITRLNTQYQDGGYYQSGIDVSRRFGANREFGVRVNGTYGDGEHIINDMNDRLVLGSIAADYTTDKLKINFDSYAIKQNRDGGSPTMVALGGKDTVNKVIAPPKGDQNYFPWLEGNSDSKFAGLSGEYQFSPYLKTFAGLGYAEKSYDGHLFGTRMIVKNEDGDASSQYYRVGANEKNKTAHIGVEGKFDTAGIQHNVGLRADYLNKKSDQHKGRGAPPVDFNTNLYDPSKEGNMPLQRPEIAPLADNKYISYTLTDQISLLNDQLQLIVGARYQDIETNNLQTKKNYQEGRISPSLGIVVKPFGEDLSLYASYVEGLSEGSTVDNVNDANDKVTFAPFVTKQYELGAKHQHGTWLNTLALYQIEKPSTMSKSIEPYTENGVTINQITTDGAETRSRGIEWSFSGAITEDLNLMGSMAYIDAKYSKAQMNQGNQVFGVPDFTATLGVDYDVPQLEGLNLNARASYVSEQYLNDTNTLELPDYTVIDLGARYKTKLGGVNTTFLANVDNITDKKYWEGAFNSNYALIGGSRTYKLGVSFDF